MTKKQRAEKIIDLLEKEYRLRTVHLIMMRHGNCLSACVWQHSVQTPE